MEFDNNKPIYLQICDTLGERIISGELHPGDRIPSVRELSADIGVNPNTVARSYEKMTDAGIIYTKRGMGYFVSDDADAIILKNEREAFLANEVPAFLRRLELLGLTLNDIQK